MRIIICDDEKFFLDQIQSHVCKFLAQNRILAEIICYTTSNEVISNIKVPTDLFLLDVKLPGNSGLELASIIRNVQPDACIIFISSITDAVFTSFMYSPLRFIRKEFISEELDEALSAFFKNYQTIPSIIQISNATGTFMIPISSINFAKSDKHYINLYCSENTYKIRGKLSDYFELFIPENILSVNQSYMVNLRYVKSYNITSVTLENNLKINLGRKYKEEFKSQFFKYQRKYYHANFL